MLVMSHKVQLAAVALVIFVFFCYGSGVLPLLGPDEPRYSQVARQMLENKDFITPYLGDFPWFEKPVLLYWLMSICYFFFGVSEFSARLPSAIAAFLSVVLVYRTVSFAAGSRRAVAVGICLATSAFFLGFSHAATFDMLLTFCITAALCNLAQFEFGTENAGSLNAFYFFCGLGLLAKGFVALILIGLAAASYITISGGWKQLSRYHPVRGLGIVIVVSLIWFAPVSLVHGVTFWEDFFYKHQFVRYTSSYYHRGGGFFFYLPVLLIGTYPWSVAPFLGLDRNLSPRRKILLRLAGCWFITTLLFFTFSRSKLPGYILPAAPAFSIFAGIALVDFFEVKSSRIRFATLFGSLHLIWIAVLFFFAPNFSVPAQAIVPFACAIAAFSLAGILFAFLRKWKLSIAAFALIPFSAIVTAVHILPERMDWYESRKLSQEIRDDLTGSRKLLLYNVYDFSPVFYTNARVELTPQGYPLPISNYRELHRYLEEKGEAFVLVANQELSWIRTADFWKIIKITSGKEHSIVHLRAK